ncbi:GGDEF domain-containing protein [Pseudomonas panipatensis]|uniref:diguanylate cyclase n=1 Tax=Pseudomonas panipatensis TaxID=428992 RepID=A0A1G8FPG5_9PSED|nr:sensor domain-containing diguanylate cyclase [Pseudomonas panipatensis]SDH83816.1 diguanylate cyclase (GGDEF) domain-containing protein [Pseudomonas panipatensis]SMP52804.1 diguanylate cyclase (GGDEF) domain-containing protein [Pseudomonas panipatensis]
MLSRRPTLIVLTSLLLTLAIAALSGWVVLQMRHDALAAAHAGGHNIARLVEHDLRHNLDIYAQTLDVVARVYNEPSVRGLPLHIRKTLLLGQAAPAKGMGTLLLTNASGEVIYDLDGSLPTRLDVGLRDFFIVQRDSNSETPYLSHPFLLAGSDAGADIAMSRRLHTTDGEFSGVVAVILRLRALRDLFSGLNIGAGGTVSLHMLDGTLLMRWPDDGSTAAPQDDSVSEVARFLQARRGDFFERAADGVERWHSFRRIGSYPLIFSVTLPSRDIYAQWQLRAWTIGLLATALDLSILGLAYLLARQFRRSGEVESELREEAGTDPLTGLNNRRSFDRRAAREWARAERAGHPLALLMLDIDKFKAYNDHYGHPAGDEALKIVAHTLGEFARRPGDCAARYGGEEFVMLLADSDREHARNLAEHIRVALQAKAVPHAQGPFGVLTLSIGVASTDCVAAESLEALLEAADTALYRAKEGGRNQVVACPASQLAGAH